MSEFTPEICRYCGCTQDTPCKVYSGGENNTCGWLHGTNHTCCNAPVCESRFYADKRRAESEAKARNRKRTPAEIEELIQEERRQSRRESRLRCKARKMRQAEAARKASAA
jgi:hypothetical protein